MPRAESYRLESFSNLSIGESAYSDSAVGRCDTRRSQSEVRAVSVPLLWLVLLVGPVFAGVFVEVSQHLSFDLLLVLH